MSNMEDNDMQVMVKSNCCDLYHHNYGWKYIVSMFDADMWHCHRTKYIYYVVDTVGQCHGNVHVT